MIQDRLWLEVERVAARYERLRFWRALAAGWLVAAVIGLSLGAMGGFAPRDWLSVLPVLGGVMAVLVVVCAWIAKASAPGHDWVARQIENEFPDLGSCLLAAMEQRPVLADGRFGFLQESVIRQALVHAACHAWPQVVPTRRLAFAAVTQCVTLGLFVLSLTNLPMIGGRSNLLVTSPKGSQPAAAAAGFSVAVEPGDAEIERGTSLLVLARVTGEMPADATLVIHPAVGDANSLEMSRSLDDPVFGGRIATVTEAFDYHVELGGQKSKSFHVAVFEYPKLERADARLVYPSYTGLEERLVQDVRTVSVVEGTKVTLICNLNKSVKSATLTAKGSDPLVLAAAPGERPVYQVTITAEKSQRLKLELIDDAGRKNVEQSEISINVVPNKPPTLKLVQPARDLEVSPLEELDLKATAWDDFGLKRIGLSFAIAGQPLVDVILGEDAAAKQKHEVANAIKFEELQAEPDQLLSYHFWAEDVGPDGNVRRTSSDMYFAEVRHFEEIFRQGHQPPGGQQQQQQQQNSQAGQQAQQLAQNQKDIINATWKLIRREIGSQPTEAYASDVEQLVTAQNALLEKAKALAEKVSDEQSQEHVTSVINAMLDAVKQLMAAHEQTSAAPLQPALAAEQAAYQALLKLRAREHEVVRQQQQQQSGQQSQSQQARSQQQRQQMQQLDLKNEENRYETQRQAQAQQQESAADRENKQVLNRLKELAQRQHDLNERLKDLQTALQEAQTEERREEVKQQLKRLQDEQRQVLRDTDELASRMESSENQEKMSDERQQLEQTRDQVRRASEALEKEQVTQAAASGTRAEKDFEELRNEFRRRASNRFNEEMREMRQSARELDQEQKKLSEKLAETTQPQTAKADSKGEPRAQKSLREDNPADEIAKGLTEQKQKLTNLNERMKQTIEEAEQTEPLLTERLYDAARNLQTQNVDRALDAAGRSLQRGLMQDAQQVERIAGKGITQLREGVEKAAEAVLGDEAEALRRAREELKNLSQELNREIARNAPSEASQLPRSAEEGERGRQGEGETNSERSPNGEPKPGERPQGQQRPGENQNGERQPGQQPNGQQPGERQPQEGQQPGQQRGRGQRPSEQQPNESQRGQPANGQQPGQQPNGQQPGQQQGNQPQRGQQSQTGQQASGAASAPRSGEENTGGLTPPRSPEQSSQQPPDSQRKDAPPQNGQRGQRGAPRLADNNQPGGPQQSAGGANREFAPISGEDFLNWSDRLRDVEEMVDDPELRAEAARIRDQARAIRAELKRHSKEPNWGLVRVNVAEPLVELSNRVSDELLRRNSKQAIVPLDRDPVPPKYSEKT
ncbi:MAG: hypothetical protein FD138_1176, partial [Planctomycetota bacterium]